MTREEAIDRLKEARAGHKEFLSVEVIDMAIKGLEQKPCSNAIDRTEAIRIASGYCHFSNIPKELAKLPPVNPQPKTGHWTYIKNSDVNGLKIVECDNCHRRAYGSTDYCPNCGAKMQEIPTD